MVSQRANNEPGGARRLRAMAVVVAVLLATYAIVLTVSRDFRQMTGRGIMVVFSGGLRAGPGGPELQRRDGRLYLRAGRAPEEEFDITAFRLETNQLHYGSSRERIPALTDPQYITVAEADRWIDADARVLLVGIGEDVRVYPLSFLRSNELVNDVVGGRPIVVAYCYLADLGAVYDRRAGGRTLTFALSSYTYADPDVWDGRDAFVLWDRQTESLWWPPVGRAVSGPMIDTPLTLVEPEQWAQTTWGRVKDAWPGARVIRPRQRPARPVVSPLDEAAAPGAGPDRPPEPLPAKAIAPRWGANPTLGAG